MGIHENDVEDIIAEKPSELYNRISTFILNIPINMEDKRNTEALSLFRKFLVKNINYKKKQKQKRKRQEQLKRKKKAEEKRKKKEEKEKKEKEKKRKQKEAEEKEKRKQKEEEEKFTPIKVQLFKDQNINNYVEDLEQILNSKFTIKKQPNVIYTPHIHVVSKREDIDIDIFSIFIFAIDSGEVSDFLTSTDFKFFSSKTGKQKKKQQNLF